MKSVRKITPMNKLCLWMRKSFSRPLVQSVHVALIVACGFIFSADGAPVEIYSSPAWVSGDGSTQVETVGILKYAYSAGYNLAYGGTINIPGKEGKVVTFKTTSTGTGSTTNGLGSDITFNKNVTRYARTGAYEPVLAITGNYRIALRDIYAVNASPYSYMMTLTNLTVGRIYLVQVWASDGYGSDRQVKYTLNDGAHSAMVQLDINNGNVDKKEGQVATFKAVAESTSMTLLLEAAVGTSACFSAIQVREVTPMYWGTDVGEWNTSGTNWDPAEDTETIWGSATAMGLNAFFTNDATATITANVWAQDINIASNTTISRAASSGTTTLTVTRNVTVEADRKLTVGSGTGGQQTVLAVSNAVTGMGSVDVKLLSRIVLGKNAIGDIPASIAGDGGDFRGAIQSMDHGDAEWSGEITCSNAGTVPRLGAGYNSVLTISGKITGYTLGIRSEADTSPVGIVLLSNPGNNYTGATTIYTPLRLGCDHAIPLGSAWTFASAVSNPSVDLNGFNQEVQSFTGTVGGSNITNSNGGASELIVNTSADQNASALLVAGNLSVVKKGSAKLTLGMSNTYTGSTTIVAGTLALSAGGDIAQSASIQVYTNATFDVTAKTGYVIQKKVVALGGMVNVGTGKTLSFAMDSVFELPLPSGVPTIPGLAVTGDVDVSNLNLVLVDVANFRYGQPYVILSTPNGAISNLPASVPSGFTVKLSAESQSLLLYRKGTIISFMN